MNPEKDRPPHRVRIICDTDLEYFRNVILGARHYAFTSGRIVLGDRWGADDKDIATMVKRGEVDGIIAQVNGAEFAKKMARWKIPVVVVSNVRPVPGRAMVTQDDAAVGRLAAEHLTSLGCAVFGFWGQRGAAYSMQRLEGFRGALELRNAAVRFYANGAGPMGEESGAALINRMARWLQRLPRPVGVFAALDVFALHLLKAAQQLGLRVPEDVAVLGAGNDEFWVDFESVPLSSIKLPSWQIGLEAATLLTEFMDGRTEAKKMQLRLPVTEVAARRSTDVLFVEDQAVMKAVTYIREHAAENIYVADVAKAAGVSRSGLQLRFRDALGRTILEEVQQVRIARVQMLLRSTEMKITEIAEACDFPNSPRLNVLFRQCTGQTPRQYRATFRHGSFG
ncbi:MAG: substrate-binding domain-containing protein [Opitutaceae bacterium]|jgi:LacI family transcriptional regulator